MAAVWWEVGIDVQKQAIQFLTCVNSSHFSFRHSQPGTAEGICSSRVVRGLLGWINRVEKECVGWCAVQH